MNKSPDNPHKFAHAYIITVGILSIVAIVSPNVVAFLARGSNGSEVGLVLLLFMALLFLIAGILGIVSLIVIPLFLSRKYFSRKFNILAILVMVVSLSVAVYGTWYASVFVQSLNQFKQLDKAQWAKDSQSMMDSYIGLKEAAAFDQAKTNGVSARVVERDGEALPVTMDHSPYRVNLYMRNGKVYKVVIEGE